MSETPTTATHASGPRAGYRLPDEADRRRQWAAALWWARDRLAEHDASYDSGDHERSHIAGRLVGWSYMVEAGQLTPWADQPEPAARPAVPSGAAAAAAGPHPDTPDRAAGILGWALLDCDGDLWLQTADGRWELIGPGEDREVVEVVDDSYGPVAEVLLASPAAGRVLRVLSEWRAADRAGGYEADPILDKLAAAVDALDGDQPAEPYPREQYEAVRDHANEQLQATADYQTGLPFGLKVGKHPSSGPDNRTYQDSGGSSGSSTPEPEPPQSERTLADLYRDLREPRSCPTCSGLSRETVGMVCQTCGTDYGPPAEPAPEPDSGPGWDRSRITELAQKARPDDDGLPGYPALSPADGAQLRAVLADRDRLDGFLRFRLAELGARYEDLHAARAELAEVTAARDRLHADLGSSMAEQRRLIREVESLRGRAELAESRLDGQAWEDLTAERDRLLGEHRRFAAELGFGDGVSEPAASLADMLDPVKEAMSAAADHDECPALCELCGETLAATVCQRCNGLGDVGSDAYSECPECAGVGRIHEGCAEASYTDLAVTVDQLRAELATARRDAAADALEDFADGRPPCRHHADLAREFAAEIRAGTRPVPGSPQPASEGDHDV